MSDNEFDMQAARDLVGDESEMRQFLGALNVAMKGGPRDFNLRPNAAWTLNEELPKVANQLEAACDEIEQILEAKEKDVRLCGRLLQENVDLKAEIDALRSSIDMAVSVMAEAVDYFRSNKKGWLEVSQKLFAVESTLREVSDDWQRKAEGRK